MNEIRVISVDYIGVIFFGLLIFVKRLGPFFLTTVRLRRILEKLLISICFSAFKRVQKKELEEGLYEL